jgi:hypothetical protein
VTLVREYQDLRIDTLALDCREQLHPLTDRHAVVELAVNDQNRRVEVVDELVW